MLIHRALFWLKKNLTDAQRQLFQEELSRLSRLPYLIQGWSGPVAATPHRAVTDHSFDFATSFHFRHLEDHEYYQTQCPEHARFVQTCQSFWDQVVVHDFEAADPD